ncbi:MAG: metallophosphoesterase family protein [Aggregatilineales bacterium]
MRLAVFSDIHGNLTALEAALADLDAAGGADRVWVLGDLAAFGPRPSTCIARLRALRETWGQDRFQIIGGNTDRYLVTGERLRTPPAADETAFGKLAQAWQERDTILNWCAGQLTWADYQDLKNLLGRELDLRVPNYGHVIGYHGTPGNDEGFLAPETEAEEAEDALLDREGRLGIGGHIHRQMDRNLGRWRAVNVGSVGLSFDTPGFAQWGLFAFADDGALTVDLRRVPYDVAQLEADLRAVGHPLPAWFMRTVRPTES